jgi:hypothetical protein
VCHHFIHSKKKGKTVSDVQFIKIDRHAFSRGVDELITFRPLREVFRNAWNGTKSSSNGAIVVIDSDTGLKSVLRNGEKQRSYHKK